MLEGDSLILRSPNLKMGMRYRQTLWTFAFVLSLRFAVIGLQAEKIASRMIYEDRMRGSIDQVL